MSASAPPASALASPAARLAWPILVALSASHFLNDTIQSLLPSIYPILQRDLGLTFGQSSGAVSSRFTQYYRYTGAALTSDLAWLLGAGFAPLVALGLASTFGIIFIGGYLISGAICTIAALTLTRAPSA